MFWVILLSLLVLASGLNQGECVAGEGGQQCTSPSFQGSGSENQILSVITPTHKQEFQTGNVPVACELASVAATTNICFKLVADPNCFGFWTDEAKASEARQLMVKDRPYHSCTRPPVSGVMKLAAACWIFQFDLVIDNKVKETVFRSIDVVAVDEHLNEQYPEVPRIHGGEISVFKTAAAHRGIGMAMEFGLGRSTVHLAGKMAETGSTEETLHSFDSLQGLPEKWRDGFDKGSFSLDDTIPQDIQKLSNVEVHVGWVNETLPSFLDANPIEPVGLLVIDFCVESGAAFVLDQLLCRLNKGSIVVFANFFNYPDWTDTSGERSAWLSAVEKWGIAFEPIGFYATFFMLQISDRPANCPGSGSESRRENDFHAVVQEWAGERLAKVQSELLTENETLREEVVNELENIIAVDPNNGEVLGSLAFALTRDISRIGDMLEYARRALVVQHRMPAPGSDPVAMLTSLHKTPSFEEKFMRNVRKHRLYHDLEQLRYLKEKNRLPQNLTDSAIAAYEEVLSQFPDAARGDMLNLSWEQWGTIGPFFNRALYVPVVSRVKGGALNPGANFTFVQEAYNSSDPHVVVVDDFFSSEAISKLLRYYREATIYYDTYHYSYLGSYLTDGLGNPLLAQIVEEVSKKLRPILCNRPLRQAWVYKYDDTKLQKGIDIHADKAAVNFNVWLGENESLEPDRGGLVIYTARAPSSWGFEIYNTSPLPRQAVELLERSHYENITVPYKQNRMIMFDSRLFHVSDVAGWKPGYERRRINLTLLFGKADSKCEQ